MRYTALIAVLTLLALALAAGCSAPPAPGNATLTPAPPVTAPASAGPAVSLGTGDARVASAGGAAEVPLVLSGAPNGLSGYNVTVSLADPSIAEIAAVAYPAWAGLKADPSVPAARVSLQAVDMTMQVPVGGTNVTLATLTVRGLKGGSTALTVTPDPKLGVQDRNGDLYAVTAVPGTLTVGA